jgi:hypothetical protein
MKETAFSPVGKSAKYGLNAIIIVYLKLAIAPITN